MLVCIPSFVIVVVVVDQLLLLLWSLFMSRIKSVAHLNESFGYALACHLVVVVVVVVVAVAVVAALVCMFIGLFVCLFACCSSIYSRLIGLSVHLTAAAVTLHATRGFDLLFGLGH